MLLQTCVDIKVSSWFSVSLSDAKLKFLKENEKKLIANENIFKSKPFLFVFVVIYM